MDRTELTVIIFPYFEAALPLIGVALGLWGSHILQARAEQRKLRVETYARLRGLSVRDLEIQEEKIRASIQSTYWHTAVTFLDDGVENARRWAVDAERQQADLAIRLADLKAEVSEVAGALRVAYPRDRELAALVNEVIKVGIVRLELETPPIGTEALNAWRAQSEDRQREIFETKLVQPYTKALSHLEKKLT